MAILGSNVWLCCVNNGPKIGEGVYVCVCERERESEVSVCERERGREGGCGRIFIVVASFQESRFLCSNK